MQNLRHKVQYALQDPRRAEQAGQRNCGIELPEDGI